MDIFITFRIAINALYRNKLRTILTMLGIVIGVGAVIGMLGVARGAQSRITGSIESMGTNSLFIMASSQTKGGVSGGWGSITSMKVDDSDAIQKECSHIKYASPYIPVGVKLVRDNQNWSSNAQGTNEHIAYISNLKTAAGSFFSAQDVQSATKVCVIGSVVRENLFPSNEEAIGGIIRINKIPFKVVGVLESKGVSGGNSDQDDTLYIPYTTVMQRMYKQDYITAILASATSRSDTAYAKDEVTELLRQRHRIREGEDNDFEIHTQEELAQMVGEFVKVFTILLAAIASVSLLVGGIGIMNIMLVSVTERIREIGIRMALGARGRDILTQFLIEALTLSLMGGVIGIGLGYIIVVIVSKMAQWPAIVTPFSIILALSFACGTGVFFGFYPAWKASKLNPIEALRHE
ncbi:MAG: ABC transporter permease [Firmicutes bacterium]|nr:ABC transporter permease [Bacillota bacterium]